jgi:proteasome lid subunit RPN8/RPN11
MSGRLAEGHRLALQQLKQVAETSDGALVVHDESEPNKFGVIEVPIELDCSDKAHQPNGLPLQPSEPAVLLIDARFPLHYPLVIVPHLRFASAPHVQWGRMICLYQAAAQWKPEDGMLGLLDRLDTWYARAAAGELDPIGQPLHVPVAYADRAAGCVVVHPNAPMAKAGKPWLGTAVLHWAVPKRVDVTAWVNLKRLWQGCASPHDVATRVEKTWTREGSAKTVRLGLAIVLPNPTTFEFPDTIFELIHALAAQGLTPDDVVNMLGMVAAINQLLSEPRAGGAARHPEPLYFLIGSPMRGIAGSDSRITHLAAWQLPALEAALVTLLLARHSDDARAAEVGRRFTEPAEAWLRHGTTSWARVYEARPEATMRRDADSPASWLNDRHVLVLGCGALGAPIAEQCVRAGAAKLTVVDNGRVSPGILVRQPYDDTDVDRPKAEVLARRLRRIGTGADVVGAVGDVLDAMQLDEAPHAHLVIDATADPAVAAHLERCRWQTREEWPALVTVGIGHLAERGVGTVSLPGSSGGGSDILRRLGLLANTDLRSELADVADDLFPQTDRPDDFQPEPGCSAPTFIGSASEVTPLASSLFSGALAILAAAKPGRTVRPMAAWVVRLGTDLNAAALPPVRLGWRNDLVVLDEQTGYEVRLAADVMDELRQQCLDITRGERPHAETGGVLLGEIDDACRVVWVRRTLPPPEDSMASSDFFLQGIAGIEELIDRNQESGGAATRFIGLWHSHPNGHTAPSDIDEDAMAALRVQDGRAPSEHSSSSLEVQPHGPTGLPAQALLTSSPSCDTHTRPARLRPDSRALKGVDLEVLLLVGGGDRA